VSRPSFPVVMLWAAAAVLLLTSGQVGGCGVVGAPPPFKTDKLAVLIVEESADRGKLSSGQLDAILSTGPGSVRDYVAKHGGDFRLLDKDTSPSLEAPWVQAAFAVERRGVPWIVAATPRTGFSVPLTPAPEVLKELEPLGGK